MHGDVCRIGSAFHCPLGCFKSKANKIPLCRKSKSNDSPCRVSHGKYLKLKSFLILTTNVF